MFAILDILLFAAGYAASIYTWPWLRTQIQGAQSEIAALEARVTALKAAVGITPVTPVAPVPPVAKPPGT